MLTKSDLRAIRGAARMIERKPGLHNFLSGRVPAKGEIPECMCALACIGLKLKMYNTMYTRVAERLGFGSSLHAHSIFYAGPLNTQGPASQVAANIRKWAAEQEALVK